MRAFNDLSKSNNRVYGLTLAYGVVGPFAMMALLVAVAFWSAYDLILRKSAFLVSRHDLFLCVPATVFVAVQLLFAVINFSTYQGSLTYLATFMGPLALYLLVWLLIPYLRKLGTDVLDVLIVSASICAIMPLPIALYQVFINQDRATGLTDNALPFALISSVFSVLSLFNILSKNSWRPYLGFAGFGCGMICLLLSGSIGLLPVVIPASIIFAIVYRQAFVRWINRTSVTIGSIMLVLFVVAASQWTERFVRLMLFIVSPDESKKFKTFNLRIQMWDAAVELIKARPFLGHGMENRVALLYQTTGLEFVQFHNAFLNAWVDSGILGVLATILLLFAPLWLAIKAPRDQLYGIRLFIASYLVAIYFVGGMSYVMFMDNVYDSVFLWVVISIAVSVPISNANSLLFPGKAGS